MPKKTARKTTKKKAAPKTTSSSRRSRINIHHSHPLYFVIAILLALIVFIFVQRIVSLRNFADDAEINSQENAFQSEMQMMHMHPSPSPTQAGY